MTRGKQPLCKAGEMCMEGQRDRIPGGDNGTRRVSNGEGKGGRSHELANTTVCQGYTEVLGVSKLLPKIRKELCEDCQTTSSVGQKGRKVEIGGGTERGVY